MATRLITRIARLENAMTAETATTEQSRAAWAAVPDETLEKVTRGARLTAAETATMQHSLPPHPAVPALGGLTDAELMAVITGAGAGE